MENKKSNQLNRRQFLNYSALGLAGLTILPSWTMANGVYMAPSDRVVLGFIGLGQQSLSDFRSYQSVSGIQIAAGCDVDSIKRERFADRVKTWQKEQKVNQRCDSYEFYEDLLSRKDIDAVHIATPDHWHALIAIHACQAKKDIYLQKPLTYTVQESIDLTKAVRDNNIVMQVGSQQRSSPEFQQAIALVRAQAIGHIETIYAALGPHAAPYDLPEEPVPANLNFNQWLGPLNNPIVHHHSDICQPVTLTERERGWGRWRYYRETGNGFTADWGAHNFDIAQAAIGMDGSGPVEFIPIGYQGTQYTTLKYQNGIVMTEQNYRPEDERTTQGYTRGGGQGISFNGTKGWIKVARGYIESSDPSLVTRNEREVGAGQFEVNSPHNQEFIDCVRSRKNPIAPVEAGASTLRVCVIANIAHELKRPVKWNPATLSFDGDKEAENHRLNKYEYRAHYSYKV